MWGGRRVGESSLIKVNQTKSEQKYDRGGGEAENVTRRWRMIEEWEWGVGNANLPSRDGQQETWKPDACAECVGMRVANLKVPLWMVPPL